VLHLRRRHGASGVVAAKRRRRGGACTHARRISCPCLLALADAPRTARLVAAQMERVQFAAKEDRLDDKLNDGAQQT
jgi:hypothetical protein